MSFTAHKAAALTAVWRFGRDSALGDETQLLALLEGIARSGSIAAAAREQSLSYRHAWGRIEVWQAHFGRALVIAGRGSGSRLTGFAQELVELDAKLRRRIAPQLIAAQEEMEALLRSQSQGTARAPQSIALVASHDLAVAALAEMLRAHQVAVDLHFRGSIDALVALAQGSCDAAGFHCPSGPLGQRIWSQYRRHLGPRRLALMRLCHRVQRLMVAKGNPKRIRSLTDLARGRVRFLNRQPGAGTRLVFDLMLREHGLEPASILGYTSEEHTHAAVAALIASGEADVALGIEAAARRFGLDFVPLVEETYYFAFARKAANGAALQTLTSAIASAEFRKRAAALPGYGLQGSGESLTVAALDRLFAPNAAD